MIFDDKAILMITHNIVFFENLAKLSFNNHQIRTLSLLLFYMQKLFGHQMAEFHVTIENMWSNDGTFKTIAARPEKLTPTKVKGKAEFHETIQNMVQWIENVV